MDRDDRVAGVVVTSEQRVLLETLELTPQGGDTSLELGELGVAGRELEKLAQVARLALEALVALDPASQTRVIGRDPRRGLLVVPETGRGHRRLELGDPRLQCYRVKGNHGPSRAGP